MTLFGRLDSFLDKLQKELGQKGEFLSPVVFTEEERRINEIKALSGVGCIKTAVQQHEMQLRKQLAFWGNELQNIEKYNKNPEYHVTSCRISNINYKNSLFWESQRNKYYIPVYYQTKIADNNIQRIEVAQTQGSFCLKEFTINIDTYKSLQDIGAEANVFLGKTQILSGKIFECVAYHAPYYYIDIIMQNIIDVIRSLDFYHLYLDIYRQKLNPLSKTISHYEKKLQRYL